MKPAPYCTRHTPRQPCLTKRANRAQHIHPLSTREEEGLEGPSSHRGEGGVQRLRTERGMNRVGTHSEIFYSALPFLRECGRHG